MARRPLKSYTVQAVAGGIEVEIITDRQKPYRYLICQDTVHPDLAEVERHLKAGLDVALYTHDKVEIVEFLERSYVTIGLPIKYHSDRYTAHKR